MNLERTLKLDGKALAEVSLIVMGERWLGQGNPKVTKHLMTRAECREIRKAKRPAPRRRSPLRQAQP